MYATTTTTTTTWKICCSGVGRCHRFLWVENLILRSIVMTLLFEVSVCCSSKWSMNRVRRKLNVQHSTTKRGVQGIGSKSKISLSSSIATKASVAVKSLAGDCVMAAWLKWRSSQCQPMFLGLFSLDNRQRSDLTRQVRQRPVEVHALQPVPTLCII